MTAQFSTKKRYQALALSLVERESFSVILSFGGNSVRLCNVGMGRQILNHYKRCIGGKDYELDGKL